MMRQSDKNCVDDISQRERERETVCGCEREREREREMPVRDNPVHE